MSELSTTTIHQEEFTEQTFMTGFERVVRAVETYRALWAEARA